jgi:hypothetical protein
MNTISIKIGFWSALTLLSAFIIWIVCFVGIFATSPLFIWTNLEAYIVYFRSNDQFFQNLAKSAMLLFGPAYVLLVNSFHDRANVERKTLSRLGLLFGLVFATLSCIHYFVQLSSVRINLERGITSGMEHFVQANPLSVMTSIDMLGWTLFLGLSSFFTALSMSENTRLGKWIRVAFYMNAISCFISLTGYLMQIDLLTFIGVNLGVGGAIITASVTSLRYFSRLKLKDKLNKRLFEEL